MPHLTMRLLTALPLLILLLIAGGLTISQSGPAQASHLCGNTGSPYGPFDLQTYEDGNYKHTYARAMELAGFNQLLPDRPSFALPALEGVQGSPYIPPVLLKSIAWIESGWAQASYDPPVQYGQVGPVLSSHDCGYGIMQVTSGMQNVSGVPNLDQAMIGGHYAFNIARGARILADKWNGAPEFRPTVGSRNTHVIEDWYYALWGYNGFASKNHPLSHDPNRPPYLCNGTQPRGNYPYQELVFGCVAHPPVRGGVQLWPAQEVQLPNLADPAFAGLANWDAFNACVYYLQCSSMNIPTPGGWHVDSTVPSLQRAQVLGEPGMILSTGSVSLVAPPGGQSPSHAIAIGNGGTGALAWRLTTTAPWLRISRVQGVSLGADLGYQHQVFNVHADASSVLPGTHTAQIIAESLYAGGTPSTISVTVQTGDGALVVAPDGRVYVMRGGLRRHIPDLATFEVEGYSGTHIIAVPEAWLSTVPAGDSLPSVLATGRLIRPPGDLVPVYVMDGGVKRHIANPGVLNACGYAFGAISILSQASLDSIPTGLTLQGAPCPALTFPLGTLLLGPDGAVWATIGQSRKWVSSVTAFLGCGYHGGNMNPVGTPILSGLVVGAPIDSCTADGSLLALRDGKVYLVQSGWKRHVPNPPTFEARGLSWASITPVPDGWLPTGKPLLNVAATGWLVRLPGDQVPVYVMDSGVRRHIISPAVLIECGFGWDAITILSAPTITGFPEGPAVVGPPCPKASFPDGTLVLGSDGKVWVTAAGRRHWIFGPGVFAACGYQWVDMNPVPDSIVNTLAHGADLMAPPCP